MTETPFKQEPCGECGNPWPGHIYVGFGLLACPDPPAALTQKTS